jgi:hypothetical protein
MMDNRQLATYIARGRAGLGISAMVAPRATLVVAFGRGADTTAARVMTRIFGVRDGALGAGGSIAIGQRSGGGDWLSMMAVCDAFDGVVMLLTPGLPKRARLIGVAALGSAAYHLYLAKDVAHQEHPPA